MTGLLKKYKYIDVYKVIDDNYISPMIPKIQRIITTRLPPEKNKLSYDILYRIFNPSVCKLDKDILLYCFRIKFRAVPKINEETIIPGNDPKCIQNKKENKQYDKDFQIGKNFWWNHWAFSDEILEYYDPTENIFLVNKNRRSSPSVRCYLIVHFLVMRL